MAQGYILQPQPGPQTRLLKSSADVVVYGGGAGGGKSFGLLMCPIRHVSTKGFGSVIFRRTFTDITQEGGLWDEAQSMYVALGAKPNENDHSMTWTHSGVSISFAHLQHEKDKFNYQGGQIPMIGFDELTHFTDTMFWYMFSRNRSACGVKSRVICTTNPDADSWVRKIIDWYVDDKGYIDPKRDGVIRYFVRNGDNLEWFDRYQDAETKAALIVKSMPDPKPDPVQMVKSFQFILSKLHDNQALMAKDPGYEGRLASMTTVDRERLLFGNWNIRYKKGNVFKREFFSIVGAIPSGARRRVRYWDRAATEAGGDFTVGALLSIGDRNDILIEDIVRGQWSPAGVEKIINATASRDGRPVEIWLEQEPGSSGVADAQYLIRTLSGFVVRANKKTGSKLDMAKPLASQAEAGNVSLLKGIWNDDFINECESFDGSGKGHDDQVDAASGAFVKLSKKPGSFGTV